MKISFYLLVIGLAFMTSCGGDSVDCDVNVFNNGTQQRVNDYNNALVVYADDPTEDNCNKFKDAANDWLNFVEDYSSCDQFDQTSFNEILQQARDALNQVPCN